MSLFDAEFFDLITQCSPDSIKNMASRAKRCGYSGIGVLDPAIKVSEMEASEDISLFSVVELNCKASALRDEIKKHKDRREIIVVKGKDEDFDRSAVETQGLDILLQPSKINNVIAKIAADNSVALGFNAGCIIRDRGESRARAITIMRTNLIHARKYGTKIILTCDAYSPYDFRTPGEIAALSAIFTMTPNEAVTAMSASPLDILKRKSPDYVQEGIEIL